MTAEQAWLADLRFILMVGLFATLLLFGLLNLPERKEPMSRPQSRAYCPLHRKLIGECPEGSHDQ